MDKLSHSSAQLAEEYGIQIGRWAQYPSNGELPFDAMWCVIPPGSRSERDCHPEIELSVVVNGDAAYEVPETGAMTDAPQGTAILLGSEEPHVVHNRSAEAPLVLLSIYWLPGKREEAGDER